MISASIHNSRTLRLLLISLAVHAGVFFGLWKIISTHPSILSALSPGGRAMSPLLIEDVGQDSTPQKPQKTSQQLSKTAESGKTISKRDAESESTSGSAATASQKSDAHASGNIQTGDPYYSQVRSQIQSHVRYTPALARKRLQGQVQVALTLSANGSVSSLNVLKSSGSTELDQLALESVQAAAPFPTFPSANPTRKLELPIDFRLR